LVEELKMPKLRNIIIFVAIGALVVLAYIFFIAKPSAPEADLVTSPNAALPNINDTGAYAGTVSGDDSKIAGNFLSLLLSVKSIKLDDSIFSNPAWANLKDSSIELTPDHTEGRPNPFAPFGADNVPPASTPTSSPVTPAPETPAAAPIPPAPNTQ
jgi:hypothetical protein